MGSTRSVFTLTAVIAVVTLFGCASAPTGPPKTIPMTDEEAATCADVGCYLIPKPALFKLVNDAIRSVCGVGDPS